MPDRASGGRVTPDRRSAGSAAAALAAAVGDASAPGTTTTTTLPRKGGTPQGQATQGASVTRPQGGTRASASARRLSVPAQTGATSSMPAMRGAGEALAVASAPPALAADAGKLPCNAFHADNALLYGPDATVWVAVLPFLQAVDAARFALTCRGRAAFVPALRRRVTAFWEYTFMQQRLHAKLKGMSAPNNPPYAADGASVVSATASASSRSPRSEQARSRGRRASAGGDSDGVAQCSPMPSEGLCLPEPHSTGSGTAADDPTGAARSAGGLRSPATFTGPARRSSVTSVTTSSFFNLGSTAGVAAPVTVEMPRPKEVVPAIDLANSAFSTPRHNDPTRFTALVGLHHPLARLVDGVMHARVATYISASPTPLAAGPARGAITSALLASTGLRPAPPRAMTGPAGGGPAAPAPRMEDAPVLAAAPDFLAAGALTGDAVHSGTVAHTPSLDTVYCSGERTAPFPLPVPPCPDPALLVEDPALLDESPLLLAVAGEGASGLASAGRASRRPASPWAATVAAMGQRGLLTAVLPDYRRERFVTAAQAAHDVAWMQGLREGRPTSLRAPWWVLRVLGELRRREDVMRCSVFPRLSMFHAQRESVEDWSTRMTWRGRLIEWLKSLVAHWSLPMPCLVDAVTLFDLYLLQCAVGLSRTTMQLVAITCLLVQLRARGAPSTLLSDIQHVAQDYAESDFVATETAMLGALGPGIFTMPSMHTVPLGAVCQREPGIMAAHSDQATAGITAPATHPRHVEALFADAVRVAHTVAMCPPLAAGGTPPANTLRGVTATPDEVSALQGMSKALDAGGLPPPSGASPSLPDGTVEGVESAYFSRDASREPSEAGSVLAFPRRRGLSQARTAGYESAMGADRDASMQESAFERSINSASGANSEHAASGLLPALGGLGAAMGAGGGPTGTSVAHGSGRSSDSALEEVTPASGAQPSLARVSLVGPGGVPVGIGGIHTGRSVSPIRLAGHAASARQSSFSSQHPESLLSAALLPSSTWSGRPLAEATGALLATLTGPPGTSALASSARSGGSGGPVHDAFHGRLPGTGGPAAWLSPFAAVTRLTVGQDVLRGFLWAPGGEVGGIFFKARSGRSGGGARGSSTGGSALAGGRVRASSGGAPVQATAAWAAEGGGGTTNAAAATASSAAGSPFTALKLPVLAKGGEGGGGSDPPPSSGLKDPSSMMTFVPSPPPREQGDEVGPRSPSPRFETSGRVEADVSGDVTVQRSGPGDGGGAASPGTFRHPSRSFTKPSPVLAPEAQDGDEAEAEEGGAGGGGTPLPDSASSARAELGLAEARSDLSVTSFSTSVWGGGGSPRFSSMASSAWGGGGGGAALGPPPPPAFVAGQHRTLDLALGVPLATLIPFTVHVPALQRVTLPLPAADRLATQSSVFPVPPPKPRAPATSARRLSSRSASPRPALSGGAVAHLPRGATGSIAEDEDGAGEEGAGEGMTPISLEASGGASGGATGDSPASDSTEQLREGLASAAVSVLPRVFLAPPALPFPVVRYRADRCQAADGTLAQRESLSGILPPSASVEEGAWYSPNASSDPHRAVACSTYAICDLLLSLMDGAWIAPVVPAVHECIYLTMRHWEFAQFSPLTQAFACIHMGILCTAKVRRRSGVFNWYRVAYATLHTDRVAVDEVLFMLYNKAERDGTLHSELPVVLQALPHLASRVATMTGGRS